MFSSDHLVSLIMKISSQWCNIILYAFPTGYVSPYHLKSKGNLTMTLEREREREEQHGNFLKYIALFTFLILSPCVLNEWIFALNWCHIPIFLFPTDNSWPYHFKLKVNLTITSEFEYQLQVSKCFSSFLRHSSNN